MDRKDFVQAWLDQVHEDISAAECLLQGGHWLYVAFLCHQALEKVLKAYYLATHDNDPPYTHSHMRLLDVCGLTDNLSGEHQAFLTLMAPMYIKARYPEQKARVAKMLTKEGCQHMIVKTKELTRWIEERLPEMKQSMLSGDTSK